ncbi:MAG: hypothetical protein Q8K00_10275 [Syntrophales bacterium]|nr:hypothetical protein [Syntrophales bacterium]
MEKDFDASLFFESAVVFFGEGSDGGGIFCSALMASFFSGGRETTFRGGSGASGWAGFDDSFFSGVTGAILTTGSFPERGSCAEGDG